MEAEPSEMNIDVVSDVVCPWCFVGKRRLEAALAQTAEPAVAVRWRPFQLDPTIPSQGLDRRAYMRAKFRDDARLAEVHARLRALGAEVGIDVRFRSDLALPQYARCASADPMGRGERSAGRSGRATVLRLFRARPRHRRPERAGRNRRRMRHGRRGRRTAVRRG